MPTFKILPFKPDSTGAAILARSLPAELIDVSRYLPNVVTNGVHVLNWGCGYSDAKVSANQPKAICNAVSKTRAFKLFDQWDIKHPEYSSSKRVAKDWYENGSYVYHRSTMEGECGRGISVKHKGTINIHPDREWLEDEDSNHYTKGFPIHREFRVHVAFDKVIEVNEKKKRNGTNPDPLKIGRAHV